jgi:hypothetical protein
MGWATEADALSDLDCLIERLRYAYSHATRPPQATFRFIVSMGQVGPDGLEAVIVLAASNAEARAAAAKAMG